MSYNVVVKPEARTDVIEAEEWYENSANGLGKKFTNAFIAATYRITESPELYPNYYNDVKRCIINKFPYSVYYYIDERKIVILGCFHFKRNPKTILKRIK